MIYFLDTNICIYFLKGAYPSLKERLFEKDPQEIKIPAIVKAELAYGAAKSMKNEEYTAVLHRFLEPFEIVAFDDAATMHYAHIRYQTETRGAPVGPNDLIIAAIVCAHNGTLVTNDVREFERVPDLMIENWTESH